MGVLSHELEKQVTKRRQAACFWGRMRGTLAVVCSSQDSVSCQEMTAKVAVVSSAAEIDVLTALSRPTALKSIGF